MPWVHTADSIVWVQPRDNSFGDGIGGNGKGGGNSDESAHYGDGENGSGMGDGRGEGCTYIGMMGTNYGDGDDGGGQGDGGMGSTLCLRRNRPPCPGE